MVFGNDFDHPIRDSLPPGFNAALRIVQWTIDPTMDGDAYSDKPYLYSPALATWNRFRIGQKINPAELMPSVHGKVVEEGADGDGKDIRSGQLAIPDDAAARRKHFQYEQNRREFVWEADRLYWADFGNPYLGFQGLFPFLILTKSDFTDHFRNNADLSLKLPGFNLPIINYLNEENHALRYVLKNRKTGDVYLVVIFSLLLLENQGSGNEGEKVENDKHDHERTQDQDGVD